MKTNSYILKGNKMLTWKAFHNECKEQLNFPDYYGENMDAWIDCVDELSSAPTIIEIRYGKKMKERAPEILNALLECAAFINFRKLEVGESATLMVSMN